MVRELVGKEVEAVLALSLEHRNEVCGINTITKEFYTHAWSHNRSRGINRRGTGETNVTSVGAAEHAGIRMATLVDPLDLGNATLSVDRLYTAAI